MFGERKKHEVAATFTVTLSFAVASSFAYLSKWAKNVVWKKTEILTRQTNKSRSSVIRGTVATMFAQK